MADDSRLDGCDADMTADPVDDADLDAVILGIDADPDKAAAYEALFAQEPPRG